MAVSRDVVALFSTSAGCRTSRDTVTSEASCSNRPAETTTSPRASAAEAMTGFHSTVSPWAKVTVFSCRAMPMNEQTTVWFPGVNVRL